MKVWGIEDLDSSQWSSKNPVLLSSISMKLQEIEHPVNTLSFRWSSKDLRTRLKFSLRGWKWLSTCHFIQQQAWSSHHYTQQCPHNLHDHTLHTSYIQQQVWSGHYDTTQGRATFLWWNVLTIFSIVMVKLSLWNILGWLHQLQRFLPTFLPCHWCHWSGSACSLNQGSVAVFVKAGLC